MKYICNLCGKEQEIYDEYYCECGGEFDEDLGDMEYEGDYIWHGFNNIDNILEDKRRGKYRIG